jgi:hypothetical protein
MPQELPGPQAMLNIPTAGQSIYGFSESGVTLEREGYVLAGVTLRLSGQ